MKKNFYIMRHGETLFNKRRKIQGWCDSPLTETGIAQAKAASLLLEGIEFDHYYSSTSERCCDTLELVTNGKVNYKRLKELKERNFGSFEGESEDLNPNRSSGFNYDSLFPNYGGETTEEAASRVVNVIHGLMAKEDHHNVLAVSHGGSSFHFLSSVANPSVVEKFGGFTNCCILHFTYEDGQFEFVKVMRPQI